MERGDLEGAIATCQEGIKLHPKSSHARIGLGNALYAKKDFDGAITAYREAIKIILTSDLPYVNGDTYNRLGNALRAKDDLDGAITAYREAIKIDPRNAEAHTNLGDALYRKGDSGGAIAAYTNLASVLKAKGDHDGAIACYREAIRIEPKYAAAHNNLAWLLATGPDGVRDGNQALEHAIRACELTAWNNGIYIDTLAAAYAEAGNFDNAIEYQKKALGLSSPAIEKEFGPEMRQRTGLYAQKRPYRDPKLHRRDPAPPPEGNEKRP
jgi:tetratricopeptide (TPR) repeat protein